jgi:hypothetical protein
MSVREMSETRTAPISLALVSAAGAAIAAPPAEKTIAAPAEKYLDSAVEIR